QGNDVGTQYRSAILTCSPAQQEAAVASREAFGKALADAGLGAVTTEIAPLTDLFYAENYHHQYQAKHVGGYCGLGGTGVTCPTGLA
ncbi:MAG: peptide-methionine (S)-S-oxide reductase, partial [Acidimicrobiia bacterium]